MINSVSSAENSNLSLSLSLTIVTQFHTTNSTELYSSRPLSLPTTPLTLPTTPLPLPACQPLDSSAKMRGIHCTLLLLNGIVISLQAIAGEDVVLECQLFPPTSASNMTVQWLKSGLSSPIHVYRHGQDDPLAKHQDYRGRTELFKGEIFKGNISLRIKNIRPDDEGRYTCSVEDGTDFKQSAVELHVQNDLFPAVPEWVPPLVITICVVIAAHCTVIYWNVKQNRRIKEWKRIQGHEEWKRIRGHEVSVTLDVETAHPWLEVSEDRKSVRRTGTRRDLPDTGKRFTYFACVLGSEGFTSGRHYWEVEVTGNRWWRLGIAAESVERKRGVTRSPETGFWIIRRHDDGMWVYTSPESRLPAGPIPGRVGVYLSYDSGTVSFYNAETKSHLHTFTGNKFTEKLYPYFGIGYENEWLRICSGSAPGL
ncbi:butyrophilin subfamily 3 member A1-like isoform X2 [Mobula hypostoma]|uniref:butyrophilin subfamily 3 member A1-like isoform X2 n=1 Tax=Mobula hypostoma TaxID=723540 RepID=UPI002FC35782